jgi:hypothetical protein
VSKNRDEKRSDIHLTTEQIAEVERRMSDDGPYATDEEVRAVFDRLTKTARARSWRK